MINPEELVIANKFLECESIEETAQQLDVTQELVAKHLDNLSVKRYIEASMDSDTYSNKGKLQDLLDKVIDTKIEELTDAGMMSKKDIADLIELQHKMSIAEGKLVNERLKLEQNYALAISKMKLSDEHNAQRIKAAEDRMQLRIDHERRLKKQEQSSYEALIDKLLNPQPRLINTVSDQ